WPVHVVETWNELKRLSLLGSEPTGAGVMKPIRQSGIQDRARFASFSGPTDPQQSMSNRMTAVQPDTQEADGWSRIFVPGFHPSVVSRFRERYAQIGVQAGPLPVARIANGLVRSLRSCETDRTARHVGVTDGNNRDVEESVRVRDVPVPGPQ